MNAKCLACSAGKTIEAYCAENQDATGCEARGNLPYQKSIRILFIFCKKIEYIFLCLFHLQVDGTCCYAMTAVCLACNQGESVAEYCGANPSTVGCPPYVTFKY